MIQRIFGVLLLNILLLTNILAQVGINENNSQPDASALLDIKSSDKGILIPRLTSAQRTAINNPAEGLMVYDTDTKSFWYFSTMWKAIGDDNLGDHIALQNINLNGQYLSGDGDTEGIFIDDDGLTGIGTNTPKEQLEVNGSIQLGDGNNPTPTAGAVRWNSTTQDFEGFMGDSWASLTYGNNTNNNQQKISGDDNSYGNAVSIDGDYAIIGAEDEDDNGSKSGSAYIFERSGNNWTQQAKLTANDGAAFDYFGVSVSISGDYAIVGADGDDDNGNSSGSAYIFERSGNNWTQQAKLTASDGVNDDDFGYSVSISGDYAIVSADNNNNGYNSGSAYIFERSGTNWTQQAKLIADDGAAFDFFGLSVSISGDYAIMGAYRDDDNGSSSGSAYIFERSGTNWTQQAKLTANDGATSDFFGYSVAISGDYAIMGAYGDDDNGLTSGSAYIFERSGNNWTQQAKIIANDGVDGDRFGNSVAISGDYAIIGTEKDDDNGNESGSAYIFVRNGTNWIQQAKLTANDDGVMADKFGIAVSISNKNVIVGCDAPKSYFFNDVDNVINDNIYIDGKGNITVDSLLSNINTNEINADDKVLINTDNTLPLIVNGRTQITAGDINNQLIIKSDVNNNLPANIFFDKTVAGTTQQSAIGVGDATQDFFIWHNNSDRLNIDENGVFTINQAFSLPNVDGTINQVLTTNGNGIASWTTITDNDNQDLSLSNNTLSLTNDASTVDLSGYLDNTDNQDLMLSGSTLGLSNDPSPVTLPWTTSSNDIYLTHSGKVGIGTTNPTKAKLEISGFADYQVPNSIGYLNKIHPTGINNSPGSAPYSIYASNHIAAAAFNAHSDERIKNIKGISNTKNDLAILMQIEITDYQLRDTIEKGNKIIKKVIAQQVAEVYPQAVTNNLTEVVPDIYQKAEIHNNWIMLATNLKVGDRVKIITETTSKVYTVSCANSDRFQVKELATGNGQPATVFIYGREVNDFHTVDYEAISMLNVSATQQLAKENTALSAEVNMLKQQVRALERQVQKINQLEVLLE